MLIPIPQTQAADTYTHRAGRASHQPGAPKGYSVLLVDDQDKASWAKAEEVTRAMKGVQQVPRERVLY